MKTEIDILQENSNGIIWSKEEEIIIVKCMQEAVNLLLNQYCSRLKEVLEATGQLTETDLEYCKALTEQQDKPENKELESWIGWLQARIPALKDSSNKLWAEQALEGFASQDKKENILLWSEGDIKEWLIKKDFASQDKWISTKDSKPAPGIYLVYFNNNAYKIAEYRSRQWRSVENNYRLWPSFYQHLTPPKTK